MTKRCPNEFAFSKILRSSGIHPGSMWSLFLVDLDDLNLEDATLGDFIAATAEALHDRQEYSYMDSGWIFEQSAVMIADQILARKREVPLARLSQLAVESIEDFGKLPAETLQRARREPIEIN